MLCCIKQYTVVNISTLYSITKLTRLKHLNQEVGIHIYFVDYNIEDGDTISTHDDDKNNG